MNAQQEINAVEAIEDSLPVLAWDDILRSVKPLSVIPATMEEELQETVAREND